MSLPSLSDELSPAEIRRVREALLDVGAEPLPEDSPPRMDRIELLERVLGQDLWGSIASPPAFGCQW